ncbi:MAG: LysM peptidoglycan-binding domain-containing protein [Vallitalea sp.]|jgi:hypothetical protein|nr:LysM peptidoglycan-binding domain-containing protein [Vallitalea sp.]
MYKNRKTFWLIIRYCITLVLLSSLLFVFSFANELDNNLDKTYLTLRIERNDTLWSIAQKNINKEYYKITDYINEIKLINNISNDTILAGDYIIIPVID